MRTIVLSLNGAYEVDADYYGIIDINLPLVLFNENEKLSDEKLVDEFKKTLDFSFVERVSNVKKLLSELQNNKSFNNDYLKKEINNYKKIRKGLVNYNLPTLEIDKLIKEVNTKIEENNKNDKSKDILKLIKNEVELLTKDGYESPIYKFTNTLNIIEYLENKDLYITDSNVINIYFKEFINFLELRGWKHIYLNNTLNERYNNNTITVNQLYDNVYEEI